MPWWLPPAASTYAGDIDFLFLLITIITGIAFVVVEVGLVWFIVKYRARPGRRAHYTHGNARAEVIWTAIPAVTVVVLGIMSNGVWVKIKARDAAPANSMPVSLAAEQFEWNVTYPGGDGQLYTDDDFTVRNQLHLVVNRPTKLELTAVDVIHSFFIPEFRIKQDAVPGLTIDVWFEPTKTGEYELACAELCGHGHYSMAARVYVHTPEEYAAWMVQQSQAPAEEEIAS